MLAAFLFNLCPPTLARGESDGFGKLIFFGIVLVVWAGAAIVNSIKQAAAKRNANLRARSVDWQPSAPAWPGVSPPPIPPAAARRPQARRVIPPPPVPRRQASFAPPPPLPLSMPAAAPARAEPASVVPPTARASAPAAPVARSASARSPTSIGAADIRRWLRPEVLRGQYFVTEVFDPPPGAVD